jgi:MutS domain V
LNGRTTQPEPPTSVSASAGRMVRDLLADLSPTRRLLKGFRKTWARVGTRDGWLADRHFALTRTESAASHVDDRTWTDLEFPKIFESLDTAVTPLGSQMLFGNLRTYVDDPDVLADRYRLYAALRADAALRERIQLKLAHVGDDSNAAIADYVFGSPPQKPRHHHLIPIWSLVSVATLAAVIVLSLPFWLWLGVVAVNAVVVHFLSLRIHRDVGTLRGCHRMLRVADGLSALAAEAPSIPALARLAERTEQRAGARKAMLWFSLSGDSVIVASISLWLNLAFLVELLAYLHAIDRFLRFRAEIAATFELVGGLDAAISVASFIERCPDHCAPVICSGALIDIEAGHHPLLAEPVENSIRLDGRSALVTGSNMAGKTTFIKMVGINVILGRTLGICLASKAVIPRSSAMALIRGEHSVASGKSHYFAEIEAIKSFIEAAAHGECRVFLIDELFNATNTVERIAAARAVLETLGANAQVLVTTHDIELQALLADSFDLYHFQENPDVEGFFDYRLRPGATAERNAIRLLGRLGFPDDVVRRAMTYAGDDS